MKWSYNNSGYFLLGHIIGKITGHSYEDYLRSTFFRAAGHDEHGRAPRRDVIKHEAHGYGFEDGRMRRR